MRDRFVGIIVAFVTLSTLTGCARGGSELHGWRTMQAGMELSWEQGAGPQGEGAFVLLYTVATGQDYAIQRHVPVESLQGPPNVRLWARATRILYLSFVLVDENGHEHQCARTLSTGKWRELNFDDFQPLIQDWSQVATLRLVDRIGSLGGQGPVSLKLAGLLFESP